MNIKKHFATILSKEMDRKEFLRFITATGLMLVGGGVILQSLGGLDKLRGDNADEAHKVSAKTHSYGGGAYGG